MKDLARPLVGRNYTIYCDNYFTSVKLFEDLLKESIYTCGTLRTERMRYLEEFKPQIKSRKGLGGRKSQTSTKGGLVFSL